MKVVKSVELDKKTMELKVQHGEVEESPSLPMQWPRAIMNSVSHICWAVILIAFFYFGGCKLFQ